MKMMSKTSTISMNGIILISANVVSVLPSRVVIAISCCGLQPRLLFRQGKHFNLQIVQLTPEVANLINKVGGSDDRRNRRKQTERCCDQGVRDARGYGA